MNNSVSKKAIGRTMEIMRAKRWSIVHSDKERGTVSEKDLIGLLSRYVNKFIG
jgi:hypothetical protein